MAFLVGALIGLSLRKLRSRLGERRQPFGQLDPLLDNIHDGVVVLDQEGNVMAANQRVAEFLGLEEAQPENRVRLALLRNPDLSAYLKAVQSGRPPESVVVESGYPEVRYLRVQASLLPPVQGGRSHLLLLTLTDVTRLHQLELVRRRFTADLSHELRTPVTSIKLLADAMVSSDRVDPDHVRRILWEADRLERLVDEILDLSRLEAGEERFEPGPFTVQDLLDEAVDRVSPRAAGEDVSIETRLESEGLDWWGDYEKLLRVVEIFLDNALKYSPPGGRILIEARRTPESQKITVSDQGPGIPHDEKPHVFRRFYKGRRQTGRPGFGLGLAIAKHIVALHGGRVFVESAVGHGASFGFLMPVTSEPGKIGSQ